MFATKTKTNSSKLSESAVILRTKDPCAPLTVYTGWTLLGAK